MSTQVFDIGASIHFFPVRTLITLDTVDSKSGEPAPGSQPGAGSGCGSPNPLHRLRRFGSVQLRINLRHNRGGMAQDGPGHVQAELPTEPSRRVVAELVRMPVRDRRPPAFSASRLPSAIPYSIAWR